MNGLPLFAGLTMALIAPEIASAGQGPLDGRYAFYQAATAAETDRGPRNDAACQKFFASDLYRYVAEFLTISGNRWDDNQDVSAVTGNVELGKGGGKVIPFTINAESEAAGGYGDGVTPARGTVTRNGKLAISITIDGQDGRRVLHYCKVSG